jgi:hypothetical protein
MCVRVCDKKLRKRRNRIRRENLGVLKKKIDAKEKKARRVRLNKNNNSDDKSTSQNKTLNILFIMIVAIYEKRQSIKRQVRWPYLRRGQMHRYQHFSMLGKHLRDKR